MIPRVVLPIFLVICAVASAQVSFEEAQRRLHEKLTTRPSSTQPISETDRLRMENRRLREENAELSHEVAELREALANAAGGSATKPSAHAQTLSPVAAKLVGRWQGGVLRDGNAFITEFVDDGTYHQSWLTSPHREAGQWNMPSDNVVEMWTTSAGDKHNRWHVVFEKDQLTFTPMAPDDTDLRGAKPLVLQHAP